MPKTMLVWQTQCSASIGDLKLSCAPDAFFVSCFSFTRQTGEPRDELIDCSIEVFVHRTAVNIASG